jgi:hypothetical protein
MQRLFHNSEHRGPGIYDEEYIDYLVKVLEKAYEYGIRCFIGMYGRYIS